MAKMGVYSMFLRAQDTVLLARKVARNERSAHRLLVNDYFLDFPTLLAGLSFRGPLLPLLHHHFALLRTRRSRCSKANKARDCVVMLQVKSPLLPQRHHHFALLRPRHTYIYSRATHSRPLIHATDSLKMQTWLARARSHTHTQRHTHTHTQTHTRK